MAASALDKAKKSYSYLQKTLNTGISDTDTVLTPNNVTNIPTDTGVSFVVDRVDSSGNKTPALRELMTGYVSGGTLAGLTRGEQGTTAQPHLANAVIEFVNSGEMWNDLIDFLLQDHSNPNGNHKTLTDNNGNEWLERGSVASAVNQVKVTNSVTGSGPTVAASGDDTNVDLNLNGKGTGRVNVDGLYPQTFAQETFRDCVASGGVIAISAGLVATISNIVYYIGGKRYTKSSIANKTFTASKDTYVDIDTTGTITYTEVANNAASPSLAANSIRIAIIVTNGTTLTVINQGDTAVTGPTVSSAILAVCDSLGNQIYPVPNQKLLAYRALTSNKTGITTLTDIAELTVPANIPANARVKLSFVGGGTSSVSGDELATYIREGSTYLMGTGGYTAAKGLALQMEVPITPSAGVHTYKISHMRFSGTGNATLYGSTSVSAGIYSITHIKVELD